MPTKSTAKTHRPSLARRKAIKPVRNRSTARKTTGSMTKPRATGVTTLASAVDLFASIQHISSADGRQAFSDVVNRVAYGTEPIAVSRRGKTLAVLVSADDYRRFRELEDFLDGLEADAAIKAFKKSGAQTIPLDEALARLKR